MKVLLDECLPKDLRKHLVGHECETVPQAGFSGKANGELLALAARSGWQVLLTMDKGMPYQQNLAGRTISLAIIRARSNRLPDLVPYVRAILTALRSIKPGQTAESVNCWRQASPRLLPDRPRASRKAAAPAHRGAGMGRQLGASVLDSTSARASEPQPLVEQGV